MLDDLDATLMRFIEREVDRPDVSASFAPFGDSFPPVDATGSIVHFLLYHVSENMELRRGDWDVERSGDGAATRSRPPIRLDCRYAISVWADGRDPITEHRVAGDVIKALYRHRRLPADLLQGELAGQEPPVRVRMAGQEFLARMFWFWSAMGAGPKLVFDYTVTITVDLAMTEELGPVVAEHRLSLQRSS